jgi:nitrite reductase/ring-hydroxylating ferredoxin subunit
VCRSKTLRDKPLGVTLLGTPLVVFRNKNGEVGALLDRCPHRNTPRSYHGWDFDTRGECQAVPGLTGEQKQKGRNAQAYPVREHDGFVWVYASPDVQPNRDLFRLPLLGLSGYTTIYQELAIEASLHAAAENILDVPHTAYLHGGLFRSTRGEHTEIEVIVRRSQGRVEAEYIGEPRPAGLAARLLALGGGTVTHVDRFILPSIAQVEYRLGEKTHLCVTSILTPVHDFYTKVFAVVSFRLSVPGWLVAPFVKPIVMRIFRQDAFILKHQSDTIRRFGGEQFSSTEIDVLGPHIYRLLKQAERGERNASEEPFERSIRMRL